MKEEALKLADDLEKGLYNLNNIDFEKASAMIRRLVEELDNKQQGLIEPKQTKPTITKLDGKVVTVTMTDDEHRITEVLWEAPKPLTDEEITYQFQHKCPRFSRLDIFKYAVKWAEERHGIK